MSSPITLEALRILDAIERRQSFAAAAEELYRVPSAISYTINKLEEDLGIKLFDRSKRKAQLTPVGRLVLEQGRQILIATEELTALAHQAADGWETELCIGIDTLLECTPVYQLIETFQRLQPRTEVRLVEEVFGGTWDALKAERCDIVIGAEGDAPMQGLETHTLGRVPFEFAVTPDHPLAQANQPISVAAIKHYPVVIVADSSRSIAARSAGLLDGRSRLVVPSMQRKIEAQCAGLGVGYLPTHRIQQELKDGRLCTLQVVDSPRPPHLISVAWRTSSKGKALKWFVSELKRMRFDAQRGLVLTGQA